MFARKKPRDFIYLDEFWDADEYWNRHFIGDKVWVYADEYRAELPGDEDYSRILIHDGNNGGWIYSRRLDDRLEVQQILESIKRPVSELQLAKLGFKPWQSAYL